MVPHRSTNQARQCLTSLSRREAVLSLWFGRSQTHTADTDNQTNNTKQTQNKAKQIIQHGWSTPDQSISFINTLAINSTLHWTAQHQEWVWCNSQKCTPKYIMTEQSKEDSLSTGRNWRWSSPKLCSKVSRYSSSFPQYVCRMMPMNSLLRYTLVKGKRRTAHRFSYFRPTWGKLSSICHNFFNFGD